jgi:hypothetical protein
MIPARLHLVMSSKRQLIIEMFVSAVRVFRLAPPHMSNADIAYGMDGYLAALGSAIEHGHKDAPEAVRVAVDRAEQRAKTGFDIAALLTEFGILRSTIVEIASQSGNIPIEEWERLAEHVHESMTEAATRFVRMTTGREATHGSVPATVAVSMRGAR